MNKTQKSLNLLLSLASTTYSVSQNLVCTCRRTDMNLTKDTYLVIMQCMQCTSPRYMVKNLRLFLFFLFVYNGGSHKIAKTDGLQSWEHGLLPLSILQGGFAQGFPIKVFSLRMTRLATYLFKSDLIQMSYNISHLC